MAPVRQQDDRHQAASVMPDVRRELLYLRKGVGYAPKRIAQCRALRGLLGGLDQPEAVLRERLTSAIWSLRDEDAALLLTVYALDADAAARPPSLQQRRDAYGQAHGIGREAVADRDAKAIDKLLVQLLTGWYPKSPLPLRVPESHNSVVMIGVLTRTVVEERRHAETRRWYQFLATFDGVEYVAVASPTNDPPLTGNDIRVETLAEPNGFVHRFWFPEPLRRGRTYYLHTYTPGDKMDERFLCEESMAFHEPTRIAAFEIAFRGVTPRIVWSFSGLTEPERPGEPGRLNTHRADNNGMVEVVKHDQHGGLYAGLAWEWL